MNDPTPLASLALPNQALLLDLEALRRRFQNIGDRRGRQGRQYSLEVLLLIGLLGKLCGYDRSRAIAHWARLREQELSQLFHLTWPKMPHSSTWSRVLGKGVDSKEVEEIVGQFFASALPSTSHELRNELPNQ